MHMQLDAAHDQGWINLPQKGDIADNVCVLLT